MKKILLEVLLGFRSFIVVTVFLVSIYLFCFNYVDYTEMGIARNIFTGEMWPQYGNGINLTAPWVRVANIDVRPIRVTVHSAGHGYSSKLVQFESKEWRTFVATEGFRYYWWANRLSFNWSYPSYRGMRDILRGYAYSYKKYPFIMILNEFESE